MSSHDCTDRISTSSQQQVHQHDDGDAELIAYYEEQRRNSRSEEWAACLDATLRQLRHEL